MRIWIIYDVAARTLILTDLGYIHRSDAIPITPIATGASSLERHALSVAQSIKAIRENERQASILDGRSARWTSEFSHQLLRAPKTPDMRKGCALTSGPLRLHSQRTATLVIMSEGDNCLQNL